VFLVTVPIGLLVLALVPKAMAADRPAATRQPDLPGLFAAIRAACLVVGRRCPDTGRTGPGGCSAAWQSRRVPLSRALLAAREASDA
jgi:hypothetical protein